jgi:beta-glucosidase
MDDSLYEDRATMFARSLNRDQRSSEEMLNEALAIAAQSDVIVAALGEASEMSGESSADQILVFLMHNVVYSKPC